MSSVITDTNNMSYDATYDTIGAGGYTYTTNTTAPVYTINTTTGTNGTGNWSFNNIPNSISVGQNLNGNVLKVQGDADIDGDLKIKGKSLTKSLEAIEERLAILHPNEELEEKWEKLRGLRKAYIELETEIKEKEQIWKILQK
jgi:hypothetical protein